MVGWLHAVPEGEKDSRSNKEQWPLPDLGDSGYIASWFGELGLIYDYKDILAWSTLTGAEPTPNEVDLLKMMSSIYSGSVSKYRRKEYNLSPPYDGRTQEEIDKMISDKMKRSLQRFR